jgi:hypothetical protein
MWPTEVTANLFFYIYKLLIFVSFNMADESCCFSGFFSSARKSRQKLAIFRWKLVNFCPTTSVSQRPTKVSSKPMKKHFFRRLWANFHRPEADGSFSDSCSAWCHPVLNALPSLKLFCCEKPIELMNSSSNLPNVWKKCWCCQKLCDYEPARCSK